MRIRTLLLYLIGNRQAILDSASDRRALWLGLLFVLSAGFAREYDGEDLLHEPWHVLIPAAASLPASFLLFTLGFVILLAKRPPRLSFLSAYLSFLGLFWMTAPLAWLYAIPYERFLAPLGAVQANLCTLGLVAMWRVVLMIRVFTVLMGYEAFAASFLVMLFADGVAVTAISFMPLPVIDVMGGIRPSESEALLSNTACGVCTLGICSFPVWALGAVYVCIASKPTWQALSLATKESAPRSRGLCYLALASIAVWVIVLPFTQPEQWLRRRVEHDLKGGRISTALEEMSVHSPKDFPPNWDPPPRHTSPSIVGILEAMAENPPAPWVRSLYLQKLANYLRSHYNRPDDEQLMKIARLLKRLPEGPGLVDELVREEARGAESLKRYFQMPEPGPGNP